MTRKLENAKALYMGGIRDGNAREAVARHTGERDTRSRTLGGVDTGSAVSS